MAKLRRLALIVLVLASALLAGGPATAQDTPPPEADAAKVQSLISTLEDEGARAQLIEQLRLLTQAQEAGEPQLITDGLGARLLSIVSDRVEQVSQSLAEAGKAINAAPAALNFV